MTLEICTWFVIIAHPNFSCFLSNNNTNKFFSVCFILCYKWSKYVYLIPAHMIIKRLIAHGRNLIQVAPLLASIIIKMRASNEGKTLSFRIIAAKTHFSSLSFLEQFFRILSQDGWSK